MHMHVNGQTSYNFTFYFDGTILRQPYFGLVQVRISYDIILPKHPHAKGRSLNQCLGLIKALN